jgi:hypothetical protein
VEYASFVLAPLLRSEQTGALGTGYTIQDSIEAFAQVNSGYLSEQKAHCSVLASDSGGVSCYNLLPKRDFASGFST